MPNYKSDQVTNLDSIPVVYPHANELYGRVRRSYFSYTTPAGGLALNDTIELTKVPKNARLLGGLCVHGAMGGTGQVELGDGTTSDKYLLAASVVAAGQIDFGNLIASNFGELLAAALTLTATVAVAGWVAAEQLDGYVDYMVD